MKHAAIPTTYKSIRFRSRLEAKWACVFDQLGWRWEYEPIDLNGWIPDFLIQTVGKPLLIEVKPIVVLDEAVSAKMERAVGLDPASEENQFCEDYHLVIVGAVAPCRHQYDDVAVGWILDDFTGWCSAVVSDVHYANPPKFGLTSGETGRWHDRITDERGKHVLWVAPESQIREFWVIAANTVQWKAPR